MTTNSMENTRWFHISMSSVSIDTKRN